MYRFMLEDYLGNLVTLPLPPENFTTKISSKNKKLDTIGLGEINLIKDIGLRDFSFKIYLPKKGNIYLENDSYSEPIFYLNNFRQIKLDEKPVRLMINRILPDNTEIFQGNVLVSLESYTVSENAGDEGSFWVELNFKEYVELNTKKVNNINENTITITNTTSSKAVPDTYIVKKGDCLWNIAKAVLNDSSRYKEIMSLNNITNVYALQIGQVLKMPQ